MTESHQRPLVIAPRKEIAMVEAPALVAACGAAGRYAWEEFFLGRIRNPYTRQAYWHAVRRFLAWCEGVEVELTKITPGMVGQYLDELTVGIPSKKLHLAAIRGLLDVLVQRHVIVLNPALSVRAPRYSAVEGKTPEITVEQCRQLLASIQLRTPLDYRDRAIIAVLIYTAARVGAVATLRIKSLTNDGTQPILRLAEKGGKARIIPVRFDLERYLRDYLAVAGLQDAGGESPLFRTAAGRSGQLTSRGISAIDICRVVKRRLQAAGIMTAASPHSFRACTATDLLMHGTALEDVQYLLGHADSRVTKLYDRRRRQVTRNIVERISV